MNKKLLFAIITVIVSISIIYAVVINLKTDNTKYHKVKRGNLEIVVNCNGEIKGEKYSEINLPEILCDQSMRVYQYKIVDVVLEGKEVKKGDYIAKIDDSQIVTMMREMIQQKEKFDSDMRNATIDSTVILSRKKEAINNAMLDLEYLKIDLEQSKFESEAYQRKTTMRYKKAEIEIDKLRRDYLLERNRQKIQVGRYDARSKEYDERIKKYQKAQQSTTITSAEDGIVVFMKDRTGKAYGKDSEINIWRPLIATLPDMSTAISENYIREIDIAKISLNDSVRITIDALPKKVFWGKVINIATIGENHKSFDMKAFKIVIRFDQTDKGMKPGMTANNDIIVESYTDRILIPLKAIFSSSGKSVIYIKDGNNEKEINVDVIAENGSYCIVKQEIERNSVLLLFQPEKFKSKALTAN